MNIDELRMAASRDTSKIDVVAALQECILKPGIYFGLPAEKYHEDPSIGSTQLRILHKSTRRYQRSSWMTPLEHRLVFKETEATVVGTALHEIVLEGIDVFHRNYVRRSPEYDLLSQGEKSAMTKAIKSNLKPNQRLLPSHEYDVCIQAAQEIVEHEQLRVSLTDGMNEVSVFWFDQLTGIPCKARFDRLKAAGIGDIKTIANQNGRPLEVAAMMDIKTRRYDLQAAHYLEGRSMLKKLIEANRIFHITPAANHTDRLELCEQIKKTSEFAFQFIFLQKSDSEVWSGVFSPKNPIIIAAAEARQAALERLLRLYRQEGTRRWPPTWRLGEIHPEDIGDHGWY